MHAPKLDFFIYFLLVYLIKREREEEEEKDKENLKNNSLKSE